MAKQIEVEQFVGGRAATTATARRHRRHRAPPPSPPRVLERGRVCTRRGVALALAAGIALGAAAAVPTNFGGT